MDKLKFKNILKNKVLITDGSMGVLLQKLGILQPGKAPEELNLTSPESLQKVHKQYLDAGSNIILANTFGANRMKLAEFGLENKLVEINQAAIKLAKEIARKYNAFVAGDVGPLGTYIKPLGALTFEEAYNTYAESVKAISSAGPDLIFIETITEIKEMKAAILAVKDNFSGPMVASMTFNADGTTVTGTDIFSFLAVAESMGVDAVGVNCSVGPKDLAKLVKTISRHTSLPVSFKPNAGMPKLINRQTVFPGTVQEFMKASIDAYKSGVNLLGGCCGTNPDYIKALADKLSGKKPVKKTVKKKFLLSSRVRAINISDSKKLIVIGERINPTNRKKFQDELSCGNFSTLRREAQEQVKSGSHMLDINLGVPGADEVSLANKSVEEIQEVVSVPLCLDSSSIDALESGLKACAGKPILNSVNGEDKNLKKVFYLAKRYGAGVIGLTTDEKGLPKTSRERIKIANKIISHAKKAGFPASEIILDFLSLSVSAMPDQGKETLNAIKESKKRWPEIKTVLGISNVSFGMPNRHIINSTFLNMAKSYGLDMAILNPYNNWSVKDKFARELLLGKDPNGKKYIEKHGTISKKSVTKKAKELLPEKKLYLAILGGNREEVPVLIKEVLNRISDPMEISNSILLNALNEVGDRFNRKEYFLPQVIRAAEASQIAFSHIKPLLKRDSDFKSGKIIMATVKGDVHDIGKNIVSAVFESHGWEVFDLGKNVETERIIETAVKENCPLIGLSALMTTTMIIMEKVVKLRDSHKIPARIIIGGAPVTKKFADEIGADGYANNAVEAIEVAKKLVSL
ncbi:MAG: homocysteine S-methyltransferase family protein [Endomicrobiales bacterium]|nr:homocysteine S-methyltransferase family protein [Endomicrobiales bacterium]